MKLVIGNKNYSSWSMRPWLLLKHFDLDFEEIKVELFTEGYQQKLAEYSASGKVPVLIDGDLTIWDSLAICEYLNDKYLQGSVLPEDIHARAVCRSYCSEMHSGFFSIRNELPMNCRSRRNVEFSEATLKEIERIDFLWSEALKQVGSSDKFLFGKFSMADCMFAPVAMRFHCYGVRLSAISQQYVQLIRSNKVVSEWCQGALSETQILPDFEIGEEISN